MSNRELEIARVVWRLGGATAREVLRELPPHVQIDFTTVQTYLARLESKGYLVSELRGRTKVYRERIAPARVIRDTIEDFLQRLFDGDSLPLLQHLIRDRKISEAEWQRLRSLVEDASEEEGDESP